MIPMEILKSNASHHKLACSGCSRQFFTNPGSIARCPQCGSVWDGKIQKYIKLKMQCKRGEDYVTVLVGKASGIGECLAGLMQDATIAFYLCSGLQVSEISKREYDDTDLDEVERQCRVFIEVMRSRVND